MVIAIDFDDTIEDRKNIPKGYRMGPPNPGAFTSISRLVDDGHTIVVFTARDIGIPAVKKSIEDWFSHFGIPYHGITNIKSPAFDVMIDNRGLHFSSWPQVMQDLRKAQEDWGTWSNTPSERSTTDKLPELIQDLTKPIPGYGLIKDATLLLTDKDNLA